MFEEVIAKTIEYRKRIAFTGIIILLIFLVLRIVTSYALFYVDTTSTISFNNITTYTSSEGSTQKIALSIGNLKLIQRDTKNIIVAGDDNVKTQTPITIPWHGFGYKKVNLVRDKNAEKVAYYSTSSDTCATYSANFDRLMYYNCNKPSFLSRYETPSTSPWINKIVTPMSYTNTGVTPYTGGVLGISYTSNTDSVSPGDIVAVTETGGITYYNSPEGLDTTKLSQAKISTDTHDLTNNRFVLSDEQGAIYLATPTNRGVEYRKIPAPTDYNPLYNQTICRLNGDSVNCYRGIAQIGERPDDFDSIKKTSNSIFSASFANNTTKTLEIEDSDFVLDTLYSTLDGRLFGRSSRTLYYFNEKNEKYQPSEIAFDVEATSAGQDLYYVQENGVFKVDSSTLDSHQVFYSSNIQSKSVYVVAGKVFAIGRLKGGGPATHAYLINSQDDTTPGKRLIDLFPIPFKDLPEAGLTDMVGDRLFISLKVTYTKSTRSFQEGIDQSEIEDKKYTVKQFLKSRNIPVNENKIQFTY